MNIDYGLLADDLGVYGKERVENYRKQAFSCIISFIPCTYNLIAVILDVQESYEEVKKGTWTPYPCDTLFFSFFFCFL